MTHAVVRGAVGGSGGTNDVHAVLTSAQDPAALLAPGSTLELELSVTAGPRAVGYGYLQLDDLAGSATVASIEDAEWFPEHRWFRVRSDAGATAVGRVRLQVADRPAKPTLRPAILAGRTSRQRTVRTPALSDRVFRLGTASVLGLRLVVPVGAGGVVRLPSGSTALEVAAPRSGTASVVDDGAALRYEPRPAFSGYDRFTFVRRTAEGARTSGTVTVFVGDAGDVPGLLTPPGGDGEGTTAYRPWQGDEIDGALPWPSPERSTRGDDAR